jgi:hypothetical protein
LVNNYTIEEYEMSKSNLFLISGKKFTGKDTMANYLADTFGYKRFAFADKLKEKSVELVKMLGGYISLKDFHDPAKKDEPIHIPIIGSITRRKILQDFGTQLIRGWCDSYWIELVLDDIINTSLNKDICITDCRFPNEIDNVAAKMGVDFRVHTIRIKRNTGIQDGHDSEVGLDHLADNAFDFVLDNNSSIEDFNSIVHEIATNLTNK